MANIDDVLKDVINEEAENIKIPSTLMNNVYHSVNLEFNNEEYKKGKKVFIWSAFRYAVALTLGMIFGYSINSQFNVYFGMNTQEKHQQANLEEGKTKKEYIQLGTANAAINQKSITQLYPDYVPEDLKLNYRYIYEDGKKVELYFSSNNPNEMLQRLTITVVGRAVQETTSSEDEKVQLKSGEAYLKASYLKNNLIDSGRLIYKIEDDCYILVDANNISREELINVVNSIKSSAEGLPDNTSDEQLMKLVSERLYGTDYSKNGMLTIKRVKEVLKEMKLQYSVVQNGTESNDDMWIAGFTVREGVVYIFSPNGKNYKDIK